SASAVWRSELCFARKQVLDLQSDLWRTTKDAAELVVVKMLERRLVGGRYEGHVFHFLNVLRALPQIELHELFDFRARGGLGIHVNKQRSRERVVGPIEHGGFGRSYGDAFGIDDLHGLHLPLLR